MAKRDDFRKQVVLRLASRAGHCCSNPDCRRPTSGPDSTAGGTVNIGVAAHITAAAPGGPRFDPRLSPSERSAADNGIWVCQWCAKLIDSDTTQFTTTLLLDWKSSAEARAQSYLQSPGRPGKTEEPALVLPSTDPAVSWLPFSARATTFVGRDAERAQLEDFLHSGSKVLWWLITGQAGTGKSRLALELCRDYRPNWNTGFLSRTDDFAGWSQFRPSRPTLIVVDYVASRAADASAMVLKLSRSSQYLPCPVRVLLLERDQGSWWHRFRREESHTEYTELIACQHDGPLQLGSLAPEALRAIAADIAHSRNKPWTDSIARTFDMRMRTLDPSGRPLFGMMAAEYSDGEATDAVVDSTLLRLVLRKEDGRRRQAMPDPAQLRKMENLIVLATLVGGLLPRSGGFSFLVHTDVASLLPDPVLADPGMYCDLVGGTSRETMLAGLQPDILGERFLLDRIASGGGPDESTRRLVLAAWTLQSDDFCDLVIRAASDFPGDAGLDTLCDVPLDSVEGRSRWGRLVGDLVRVANRSTDERTRRLLEELRQLADTHHAEVELQSALTRAELYLGNVFLFSEEDYARAAAQFEAAIARAGAGTDTEAAAINNRGILHHEVQDEAKAFADWSDVIAKDGISNEARACSLNNRADIFARRGAHDDAIRDRSAVLALKETSPDRRYIALIRRSRSYLQLGRTNDAMRDLESILNTEDIAPEQKAEALVARGAIFRDLGRLGDARADLEAVVATEELFPGTSASALVGLADLARREQEATRARTYLDMALRSSDADDSTLVEALIVSGRLLIKEGDTAAAEGIWQSILANQNATTRQKSIAANRGGDFPSAALQSEE